MADDPIASQVGVVGATISPATKKSPPISAVRPFVRVVVCSSIVPGDQLDKYRWYRFVAGVPAGDQETLAMNGASASIAFQDGASTRTVNGCSGLVSLTANDSLSGGQNAVIRLSPMGPSAFLGRRIRAFDRVRIEAIYPPIPGVTELASWLVFDGLVTHVQGMVSGGGGDQFRGTITISCSGPACILSGAVYNWQNQIHPDEQVMAKLSQTLLHETMGTSAAPPQEIIKAFISGALGSSMSLRVGDPNNRDGLDILDYIRFGDAQDWSCVRFNKTALAYPSPWNLINQSSGASFWQLAQTVAEPVWHELFFGYRNVDDYVRPVLIHRPRPFPGSPEFDENWKALPVRRLGSWPTPGFLDVTETIESTKRPNCFHWAGISLGDQSRELEYMKLSLGFVTSDNMVNRFGYSSVGVRTKLAPLAPGAPVPDMMEFARTGLEHYAQQEVVLPNMKSHSLGGTFIPVRPGEVLENNVLGNAPDDLMTGYVTSTSFGLHSSGDSFSMSMNAEVERVILGTDAAGYPDAARGLVTDLSYVAYAGRGIGPNRTPPRYGLSYSAPQDGEITNTEIPPDLVAPIKDAASRHGVPAWVVAHVLHNETALGRNLGGLATRKNGIAQITGVATSDLIQAGHVNPDGTPFTARDKGDRVKSVYACAAVLKRAKAALIAGGMPSSAESYWSWVVRGYRWGAGSSLDLGRATHWKWPSTGEAFPDYARYWSPSGINNAQKVWGYLG